MKVKEQIINYLGGANGLGRFSWTIARNIDRPEPSVRRTLVELYYTGKIERGGSSYNGYLYSLR